MSRERKILFRVDAGDRIGLGHFFRSVNLANLLREAGHKIVFTHTPSNFWKEIKESGFKFDTIPLQADEQFQNELDVITSFDFDVLYVDGFIDYKESFLKDIKSKKVKLVFYQNLTEAKKHADIFILPSIHQDETFFLDFGSDTKMYAGLDYFTFSEDINKLKRKATPDEIRSIAVIAGGSDPENTLFKIYELLKASSIFEEKQFNFFYGSNYLHKENIQLNSKFGNSWKLFDHSEILNCDLLISAFGVSTYEFLALGMPVVAYGHQAQNAYSANYLAENTKSLISLGDIASIEAEHISNTLDQIVKGEIDWKRMLANAMEIIDLKGVDRVKDILENA